MLALVWIAGPLSGVLVQPYVGLKSDNCRLRWGKRRPFIVGGAAATILSLMVLSWAKEIMGGFLGIFGADPESEGVRTCIMLFAVLFIYVLDFAINVSKYFERPYYPTVRLLQSFSPGRCSCLYCRCRTYPPARISQRMADAIRGYR
jgi:solute carrier family 45 protein 1/2/4